MKKDEYRNGLLEQLDTIFSEVSKMKNLSIILDKVWRDTIQEEIIQADLEPVFKSDKAWMFFELIHWLRGAGWFEEGQKLLFERKESELSNGQKMALAFLGPDPLKVLLPVLEKRLNSYFTSGLNSQLLKDKFNLLIKNRFSKAFFNYLFEILALGSFSSCGLLKGIEIPVGTQGSTFDGLIEIDCRSIYTEVTLTTQDILSPFPGIHSASPDVLYNQVLYKIEKKVADSRQIALVKSSPSLLVIGRNPRGADQTISDLVIKNCFDNSKFQKLSGVIVSDSWKFFDAQFYKGTNPEIEFSSNEIDQIKSCLCSE
ncbi:MAG: hypothetical protein A2Y79_02030 [Deltaproteobacteria bacterium RBG_13_43_22]|nr:MAG: hypothetical protein A2Y79_02030 [Deltaproteobacteria bacterium RBG_13_43_22]